MSWDLARFGPSMRAAFPEGRLGQEHATVLAEGLPAAELLSLDSEGLTAIGQAAERGGEAMAALGVALETRILRRLGALVEIVCAPAHQQYARQLADQLHAYWPQLELRVHAPSAKAAPRASTFDVLWIERWGSSRRSKILYTHVAARNGGLPPTKLPGERHLWREITLLVDGRVLPN